MSTRKMTLGQSLVEFALLFPMLIFLIFGLFDLGRVVLYFSTLNTAVREATRDAIVLKYVPLSEESLKGTIKGYVQNYLFDIKELTDNCTVASTPICSITVNYINAIPPTNPEDVYDPKVQVIITYQFKMITPFISLFVGNDGKIPIEVQSTMLLAPAAKP